MLLEGWVRAHVGRGGEQGLWAEGWPVECGGGGAGRICVHSSKGPVWLESKRCGVKEDGETGNTFRRGSRQAGP